ncbi:MAG TPA: pyridoxal-phosphate dependent enzyme [Flavisolibacter sp.]|nr:pyridoxal-phosphate dependent enzyme [Flavisolibacter sp.]
MSSIDWGQCRIDPVSSLLKFHTTASVLRLDLLHPVISGNKWFKLQNYLKEALASGKTTLLSFGGAFSNHIVATAAAAKQAGLKSIGIIRGEQGSFPSHTLEAARSYGMFIYFSDRADYRSKKLPPAVLKEHDPLAIYTIGEGGYGLPGAHGAEAILQQGDTSIYTHILAAVGTGTTLAGLIRASSSAQAVTGISVLKNNRSLTAEINELLPENRQDGFALLHDFHFGGYARYNEELIRFMNQWYESTGIPSDFVYTAKLFYAASHLSAQGYFPPQSKLLLIHSGGLQGNLTLPKGKLIF